MAGVLKIRNPGTGKFEDIPAIVGPAGKGFPAGGTTGQVLKKVSDNDYDAEWSDAATGSVASVNGKAPDAGGAVTLTPDDLGAASAESVSALKDDLADAWTSGKTYAVGDYCISGNRLYKCKTAHTAGGAFDVSYWDAVRIADEVAGMRQTTYYCGSSGKSNELIFDAANWENGTYVIVNKFQTGLIVEFLRKINQSVHLTSIYAEHSVSGTTVTLHCGSWFSEIYAKKL